MRNTIGQRLAIMAVLALVPAAAWAQETDLGDAPTPVAAEDPQALHVNVEVLAGLGYAAPLHDSGSATSSPKLTFGTLLTARSGMLRAGLSLDVVAALFGTTVNHAGVVIGAIHDFEAPFRVELLGEGGIAYYSNVGHDLFVQSVNGPSSTSLPYLGARLGASWRFGPARSGLVGVWLSAQSDLYTRTLEQDVTTCLLGCSTAHQRETLGGISAMASVRLGFAP